MNRQDGRKAIQVQLKWKEEEVVEAFHALKEMLTEKLELFVVDPKNPPDSELMPALLPLEQCWNRNREGIGYLLVSCQGN